VNILPIVESSVQAAKHWWFLLLSVSELGQYSLGISWVSSDIFVISSKVTFGLVDHWFWRLWSRCPFTIATDHGGCWHSVCSDRPGKLLM